MPIIVITPTGSADSTPYVPQTPSPGMYAQFTEDNRGFNVGCDIRPVAPTTSYDPWADRNAATAPAAKMDASEFWDNINIPYSAYFPSNHSSPAHQLTKPHHHQAMDTLLGTSPYRTGSSHPSLYQPSRNPSPAPQLPISTPLGTAIGRTSRSSITHVASHVVPHEQPLGSDSPINSKSNHSLRQSYSCPLSHDMDVSQARQVTQTPFTSHALQHPSPHSLLTESPRVPSRPPS